MGLSSLELPLVFYSIDIHHHFALHSALASTFDLTYVAQKDFVSELKSVNPLARATWLPLWNSSNAVVKNWDERIFRYEALFVGTLNAELNPLRVEFFKSLKSNTHITALSGDFRELYPQSMVVLNQTVKGDLNFRVFEAIGSLSCLLTENITNGFNELFVHNEDCLVYQRGDCADISAKIERLLQNPQLRRKLAFNGYHKVIRYHQPCHRAKTISDDIGALVQDSKPKIRSKYSEAINFLHLSLHHYRNNHCLRSDILKISLAFAREAIKSKEPISDSIICLIAKIGIEMGENVYAELLKELGFSYPEYQCLHLLKLANLAKTAPDSDEFGQLTEKFDQLLGEGKALPIANDLLESLRMM